MGDEKLLLCWRNGKQEGRREWMKQWIQLWSSLQETALQSTAKAAQQQACMWSSSSRASRLLTNACVTRDSVCLSERGVVSPPSVRCWCSPHLYSACLPASWAAASWMRWRDAARSAYLTRSLACSPSALFLSSSLTLSLCTLTGCVPFPLASSSLLSSSSYIISYVRVSCCSLVALRAVCSQQKGFPASLHKVEFTDGNAIHPTLQKHISFSCHPSFYLPLSMSTFRALLSMVASMVFAVVMTNLLVDAFCRGQRSVLETTVVKKHWQRTCITQRNEDLLCLVYIKQFKQFAVECVTSQ